MIIHSFISLEEIKNNIFYFQKFVGLKDYCSNNFENYSNMMGLKNAASPPSSILVMRKISKINPD